MKTPSLLEKKIRPFDTLCYTMIYISTFLVFALIAIILLYCIVQGKDHVSWAFITEAPSIIQNTEGIGGNILNTLYLIFLSLLIAIPFSLGCAVYLNEYAKPGRFVNAVNFATETLAGIPSIIFGIFGMEFFGTVLGFHFSIFTGALTLSILIFPLITRNTQEALKTVPKSYREGALGLGVTKWVMIRTILLPSALPGILTGLILAIGRIIGESAALLFTAGSGYQLPDGITQYFSKFMESGGSLSVQLYLSMANADFNTAYGLALVLIVISLGLNFLAHRGVALFDPNKKLKIKEKK